MALMTAVSLLRPASLAALLALASLVVPAAPARAQTVVLMVNGEPITNFDIEQRAKLDALTTRKMPPRDEVIKELIDDKIKIREAKKYSLDPPPSEIDGMFANMAARMRISADQLTRTLEAQGIRPDTLKSKIRADSVWQGLVRGRFKDSLTVTEKDVASQIPLKDGDKADSFEYTLRPIVLVVPRGAPAGTLEARRREAEALRARVQSCGEAIDLFRTMRDAAIRDAVIKTSADLAPPLRKLLDDTPIGKLTPPENTKQGVEMVALCGRKPTTVDTPEKSEARNKLFLQKFEAKSNAYLADIRKAAMIERRGQ
jgi:peptidyl-prolyl cis-trans isomerase SurA